MNEALKNRTNFKAIGVMSGTSLDGMDIAAVDFQIRDDKWSFELLASQMVSYTKAWENKLKNAPALSGEDLCRLHSEYGKLIGEQAMGFIQDTSFAPDFIASHGHTIFHRPEKGYTLQIGNGASISAITNTLCVADFRIGDVALGGQGAPLVPIGDKLLFSDSDYCLNLGGFANISYDKNGERLAFDICPVNIVLNCFAEKVGMPYDKSGELGRKGEVDTALLEKLNRLPFYKQAAPKSLGREWIETEFSPILNDFTISDVDKMRTMYEHIAIQISQTVSGNGKLLITGGGTFNTFLIERIKALSSTEIIIPSKEIIDFKEAIIFAFLGVLRLKGINNCLASATGASKDSRGGLIFYP